LAAQGLRNFDTGAEKIEDEQLVEKLRNKANGMVYQSVGLALLSTAISIFIAYIIKR